MILLLRIMKLLDVVENAGHKEVECHYSDTVHTQFHRQVTFAGVIGPLSFSGIREVIHLTVWVRIKFTGYFGGKLHMGRETARSVKTQLSLCLKQL